MVEFEASYTTMYQRLGKCIQNWDFPPRHSPPQWTKQTASATSNRERNFHDEGTTADDGEPDCLKIQTKQFYKELGRIAARDHMNQIRQKTFSIPSPHYADRMSAGIPPIAMQKTRTRYLDIEDTHATIA